MLAHAVIKALGGFKCAKFAIWMLIRDTTRSERECWWSSKRMQAEGNHKALHQFLLARNASDVSIQYKFHSLKFHTNYNTLRGESKFPRLALSWTSTSFILATFTKSVAEQVQTLCSLWRRNSNPPLCKCLQEWRVPLMNQVELGLRESSSLLTGGFLCSQEGTTWKAPRTELHRDLKWRKNMINVIDECCRRKRSRCQWR